MTATALALDFTHPSIQAAHALAARLMRGESIDRSTIIAAMTKAYGGGSADGHWSLRAAFDALELAQVLALHQKPPSGSPAEILAQLVAHGAGLPTHSVRSEAQIALQQFSTPVPIAYLAARLLGVVAGETVLEPSAGTGLLAVFAALAGAELVLNERDPGRAELLEVAFPARLVTRHDAEILGDHLGGQRFDAVLINPPFSRSEGRGIDRRAGLRHLRAALSLLAPDGRCVAILPDRFDRTAIDWSTATTGYVVTAAYDLPASSFAKHGTTQAVSLVRLELAGAAEGPRVVCETLSCALSRIEARATPEPAPRRAGRVLPPCGAASLGLFRTASAAVSPQAIPRARPETAAREIRYSVHDAPPATGPSSGLYLPYRPSRIALPDAACHRRCRASGARVRIDAPVLLWRQPGQYPPRDPQRHGQGQ